MVLIQLRLACNVMRLSGAFSLALLTVAKSLVVRLDVMESQRTNEADRERSANHRLVAPLRWAIPWWHGRIMSTSAGL